MAWALAIVFGVVGAVPLLQEAGWLPSSVNAEDPRWVLVCVGSVFIAGGLAIANQYGFQRRTYGLALLQYVLSLVITGAMTALAAWIAFGSGERRFRTNLPFLSPQVSSALGRLAFGLGTLLMIGVFVVFAVAGARQLLDKSR
jgi:hypothetical protein